MNVLDISYGVWKSVTQAGSLTTAYQTTQRPNRNYIWSGNSTEVFRTMVANSDYNDWNVNFQPAAILVLSEDEALAKLAEVSSGGAINALNTISVTIPNTISAYTAASGADRGSGSVPGQEMRYEKQTNVSLPPLSAAPATVYQITEESVFYKIAFQLDSDNIFIQIEIDGTDIFTSGDGLEFEGLEDLCLGYSGGSYDTDSLVGTNFGLYQYGSNKWIWEPPSPLHVLSSMKIKMKASDSSTSKDYLKGIAIRRSLV